MDLLEIRKKAKQQRKQAESAKPAPSVEASESPVASDAPAVDVEPVRTHDVPATETLSEPASLDGTEERDASDGENEFEIPDDWESQLDTETAARDADPEGVEFADSDFLELASEELFRHTYDLDQPEEEQQREVLLCRIADEEYGIDIHRIKEIIKLRSITEIPRAPKFILGIITLRGTVIPVLDLRERLRLETAEFTRQNKIVVVQYNSQFFGLIVDAVIEVSRVPESSVEDTPSVMVGVEGRFIEGIGRAGKQMIILLKLDEVLDIDFKPAA